jgi:hypothetical protein
MIKLKIISYHFLKERSLTILPTLSHNNGRINILDKRLTTHSPNLLVDKNFKPLSPVLNELILINAVIAAERELLLQSFTRQGRNNNLKFNYT